MDTQKVRRCTEELQRSSMWAAFKVNWPDWQIVFHELPCRGENIDHEDRVIWIDVRARSVQTRGPVWAAAHGVAHVFFRDHVGAGGGFTRWEESEANRFADNWFATVHDYRSRQQNQVA